HPTPISGWQGQRFHQFNQVLIRVKHKGNRAFAVIHLLGRRLDPDTLLFQITYRLTHVLDHQGQMTKGPALLIRLFLVPIPGQLQTGLRALIKAEKHIGEAAGLIVRMTHNMHAQNIAVKRQGSLQIQDAQHDMIKAKLYFGSAHSKGRRVENCNVAKPPSLHHDRSSRVHEKYSSLTHWLPSAPTRWSG